MTNSRSCLVLFTVILALVVAIGETAAQLQAAAPLREIKVVRLDQRIDKLFPSNDKIDLIVSGRKWVEGPVWNRKEGYLLFSDIPNNSVFKWQQGNGVSLFLKPSGYTGAVPFPGAEPGSNGLAFDALDRLVLAQHGDRRIVRREQDGRLTTLASHYDGKRINSPNDLVFAMNGDLYFTDPPFGLPKGFEDPSKEVPFQGVYRLSTKGQLTLLISDIKAPNGIALSPDARKLYVSDVNYERSAWLVYDIKADGTTANGRVFADAKQWRRRPFFGPDGFKLDQAGNLFGARPGGVSIFAPDGTHIGSIETGHPVSNVAWGEDGSTLFITGGESVYRIRLTARGMGF
ncbi:MAG: SMP-30/gluconolactonase/LRE family protein [Deltaproteobacteria bacterium]|nr:SMP-30/gluconolactonase/LRE family protein [Deltaproteobacteria bacterium]